jgi:putative endonuclease
MVVRDAYECEKEPATYIIDSAPNGILYVGVTSDLHTRMMEHREGTFDGFTKRYDVKQLVYYEIFETMPEAITRETRLKKWNRAWKVRLIHRMNPSWADLFSEADGIAPVGPGGHRPSDFSNETRNGVRERGWPPARP